MATNEFAALGAWEDRPKRVTSADLTTLSIDSQQAFIWTRLDGIATVAEVCAMTGLGEAPTLSALAHLVAVGAATIPPSDGPRTPINPGPANNDEALLGSVERPAEQSVERPAEQSVERPAEQSVERSGDRRFRRVGEAPVERPGRPIERTLGTSSVQRSPVPSLSDPMEASVELSRPATSPGISLGNSGQAVLVEQVEDLPDFHGVDARDTRWLKSKGWHGFVPGIPWSRPGEDRFGRFKFDRRRLLERCELTITTRREIIFLDAMTDQLDHFEYLDMQPTDNQKEWRRAYFRFSKRFHPDTFFRREVGSFGEMARRIYTRATDLHDTFSVDDDLRAVYLRAVNARNTAYRDALETARLAREALRQRQVGEEKSRRGEREQSRRADLQRQAIRRKVALRSRLESTSRERRERRGNPMQGRIDRATQFYERGMKQYEGEKFIEAATSLQLAMNFDPNNDSYRLAYEKVSHKAKAIRAEMIWKTGYMQESVARLDEAMELYAEAVAIQRRPDFCIHLAELMVSMDHDLHRAAELARSACDAQPENVDYLLLLARIYEKESLVKKATAALDRAARLSPKDERIKKAYKALKRL
ncbi:MAG: tetratricopeptide (TPR) repeat protein [Bradymonadia bacterium]|jgi:tetratricopeptide (TPR) repeat protein